MWRTRRGRPSALYQNPGTISLFAKTACFFSSGTYRIFSSVILMSLMSTSTSTPAHRPPARGIRNPNMLKVPPKSTEIQRNPPKSIILPNALFFGPSGGKSNAAHPFSILPPSNFELFCDERPTTSDKWKRSAEAAVAHKCGAP